MQRVVNVRWVLRHLLKAGTTATGIPFPSYLQGQRVERYIQQCCLSLGDVRNTGDVSSI